MHNIRTNIRESWSNNLKREGKIKQNGIKHDSIIQTYPSLLKITK